MINPEREPTVHGHAQSRDIDETVTAGEHSQQQVLKFGDRAPLAIAIIALVIATAGATAAVTIALMERSHVDQMVLLMDQHRSAQFAQSDTYRLAELAEIKRNYKLIDNDWVQMNAYLASSDVIKDANGFYVKNGKRLRSRGR